MTAMLARSADTDPAAEKVQIDLLRSASPGRRIQMALSLSGEVMALARRGIQRSMPDASAAELQLRFVELLYGRALAEELRAHLVARAK